MRHFLLLLLVGCGGGGGGGEPITGTVSLDYGSDKPKLSVGAAVQDKESPNRMVVQIGTGGIDCDTNLEDFEEMPPSGTHVVFSVDKSVAMTNGSVGVMKVSSRSLSLNSGPGTVTITAVEPRVTGSVSFATTDDEVGNILVAGTFDVIRCF